MQPPAPVIKGYRLFRLLGEGGMGQVFLAEDMALGRRVAVKVISQSFEGRGDARRRFLREARAMATVEHPHVVRVYAFGEAEGSAYFVMEYVEGETLSERIRRAGRLPVEEALRILRQVAQALEAAWEKRVVHRDIKLSNILLDRKGQARVADFGLAKPVRLDSDTSLTATGSMLGTPHYVSPEQARGRPVDFRSDIYSLGIVLYEMLTGERPFEGTTPFDVVAKHIHERLPALRQRQPDLPEEVARLVDWMTQKDPDSRPPSYAALLAGLEGPATPADAMSATSTMRRPAPRRRRRALTLTAGALALAVWGWGLWELFFYRAPAGAPADTRLVVAVTPFYGPDEDSAKEGRVMAALVERVITQRLGARDVRVIGVEETKQPVRDHASARALGERLGASAVVWGESFVLRGEAEIQPYFTLVSRATTDEGRGQHLKAFGHQDPFEALKERAVGPVVLGAQAPNQIELRKTGAAGVGDLVLILAGVHALYTEGKAEKALPLFEQAPRSPESLRYTAEALLRLKRPEEAGRALREAIALDPRDPIQRAPPRGDPRLLQRAVPAPRVLWVHPVAAKRRRQGRLGACGQLRGLPGVGSAGAERLLRRPLHPRRARSGPSPGPPEGSDAALAPLLSRPGALGTGQQGGGRPGVVRDVRRGLPRRAVLRVRAHGGGLRAQRTERLGRSGLRGGPRPPEDAATAHRILDAP